MISQTIVENMNYKKKKKLNKKIGTHALWLFQYVFFFGKEHTDMLANAWNDILRPGNHAQCKGKKHSIKFILKDLNSDPVVIIASSNFFLNKNMKSVSSTLLATKEFSNIRDYHSD